MLNVIIALCVVAGAFCTIKAMIESNVALESEQPPRDIVNQELCGWIGLGIIIGIVLIAIFA